MKDALQMLTQENVATLLHTTRDSVTMLREAGVLKATKIGKHYMYSQSGISEFQQDYAGLDVSNVYRAMESKQIVEEKKKQSHQTLLR